MKNSNPHCKHPTNLPVRLFADCGAIVQCISICFLSIQAQIAAAIVLQCLCQFVGSSQWTSIKPIYIFLKPYTLHNSSKIPKMHSISTEQNASHFLYTFLAFLDVSCHFEYFSHFLQIVLTPPKNVWVKQGATQWHQASGGSMILVRGAQQSFGPRGPWAQNLLKNRGFPLKIEWDWKKISGVRGPGPQVPLDPVAHLVFPACHIVFWKVKPCAKARSSFRVVSRRPSFLRPQFKSFHEIVLEEQKS